MNPASDSYFGIYADSTPTDNGVAVFELSDNRVDRERAREVSAADDRDDHFRQPSQVSSVIAGFSIKPAWRMASI